MERGRPKVLSKRNRPPQLQPTQADSSRTETTSSNATEETTSSNNGKFSIPVEPSRSVKILTDDLRWTEQGADLLLENNADFLTIGIIGLQGSGKSTIASFLAGNTPGDLYRSYVFRPQSIDHMEKAWHQTTGIDMFVTHERVIFLDCQPSFSLSVLDALVDEQKVPVEYLQADKYTEVQSLQLLSFLMTVCHCIVVVADWIVDVDFVRMLQAAESLRPLVAAGLGGADSSEAGRPSFPHFVFVVNKASHEMFSSQRLVLIDRTLTALFCQSNLQYHSTVSVGRRLASSRPAAKDAMKDAMKDSTSGAPVEEPPAGADDPEPPSSLKPFNLYVLPVIRRQSNLPSSRYPSAAEPLLYSGLPEYQGHCAAEKLVDDLREQLYALPRHALSSNSSMTEKQWFQFAGKICEAVKKSALLAEFSRLL